MPRTYVKRLPVLQTYLAPILAEDSMPEAGRKILLNNFVDMLMHEGGLTGDNPVHAVHQMRVATRRLRSAFRIMEGYYHPGMIRPLLKNLKYTAQMLGTVRDLDVMIQRLQEFQVSGNEAQQAAFAILIQQLTRKQNTCRAHLEDWLDSREYRRFIKQFSAFVTESGYGALKPADSAVPYQVRHVVPTLFYEQLARVRAYDTLLPTDDANLLHRLRIECKRLRYTLTFFDNVLGTTVGDFIDEVKAIQEYLGQLNDLITAQQHLHMGENNPEENGDVLEPYREQLKQEAVALIEGFEEVWLHFNKRAVQRKLSDALLVMR
jgi:CHAD domain-containing protein